MNPISFYFDLFLKERFWSWTVISIAYLLLTLVVRSVVFRRLAMELKQIDRGLYSAVVRVYLKNSPAGWFVFLISLLLVIFLWRRGRDVLLDRFALLAFAIGIPITFCTSLVFHLVAFSNALLTLLRQRAGVEQEF